MGRLPPWRSLPSRLVRLACLAPAVAAGLRAARQPSLTCDISDVKANSGRDIFMHRQSLHRPPLCEPAKQQTWLPAATNCSVHEGPIEFRKAAIPFWEGNACPLTVEGLKRAGAPAGHEGARLRLRRAMWKVLQGERAVVTVLGGSMTVGHRSLRSWPDRLGDLFRKLNLPVTVVNRGQGGTTSRWVLANWQSLTQDLSRSDLILIDYGINDQGKNADFRTMDGLGDQLLTGVYRDVVKMLLSLPNKPAVVDLETFRTLNIMTMARFEESTLLQRECAEFDITTHRHWRVVKELDIPTLSYPEAVCASGRTFWMREGLEEADENGLQHPGSVTHDLFARVVRGVLLQEMDDVCTNGIRGTDSPEDAADKVGYHIKCLAEPLSYYESRHGIDGFKPSSNFGMTWSFKEDVPGKPGWVAAGGTLAEGRTMMQRYGQLSFPVTTESGWVQVEFLGTYEKIGFVSVWLDDKEPGDENSCQLDGLWQDHTSQSRYALMKTNLPPGNHTLHFRAYGMKIKLLGVASC